MAGYKDWIDAIDIKVDYFADIKIISASDN